MSKALSEALEILREYATIDFGCNMENHHKRLDRVIAGLEALQPPKGIEWCKQCEHYSEGIQKDSFNWNKCDYGWECKRYYKDRYEPRDS